MTKQNKTEKYLNEMLAAFDSRAAYELSKNAENSNIQTTRADLKASVNHEAIAKLMMQANVSADFINRAERSNSRFNVYSAEKIINIARFAASAAALNHYTLNILKSIVACQIAEIDFTQADAVSACSLSVKVNSAKVALISQYQKHVSANTASTQASSSLNALLMTNLIYETRNAANVTCFKLHDTEYAHDFCAHDALVRCSTVAH